MWNLFCKVEKKSMWFWFAGIGKYILFVNDKKNSKGSSQTKCEVAQVTAWRRGRGVSMAASLGFRGAASGLWYWSGRRRPVGNLAAVFSRSMTSKTPVGFIGLGNMGNPMVKNLMKHGYPFILYDAFPDVCKEFKEAGEQVASSLAEVAEKAVRIITMLPSSMNSVEVYSGENGILKKVKKGSLLIDSSTTDPSVSKELAKEVEKMGAVFMDAPVSGGVGAARSGNLTFMVGGVEEEFAAAQELLGCMGSNVVYCGAVGTGQSAKICNNMLLTVSMIGTAEAMNLGIRSGLDPKLLAKILNMSSGRCWSSDTYNPVPGVMDGVPSCNNYQGGFGTTLMAKDLGLAQDSNSPRKPGPSDIQDDVFKGLLKERLLIRVPVSTGRGDLLTALWTWTLLGTKLCPELPLAHTRSIGFNQRSSV